MFGEEKIITIEHEILKENHETLLRDYEILQKRIKHEEETYDIMKKHLQSKTKELEVTNTRLLEDCERKRIEMEKYKKLFEEMEKKKTMENKVNKFTIDELMKKNQELLLEKRKEEEDLEKMQNKYVELAKKFDVVEAECVYLKSLYDVEVAASGSATPVMSGIGDTEHFIGHGDTEHLIGHGDTEHLIGHGGNEVNKNVKNNVIDAVLISDESDAENDKPQQSVDGNQEEEQFRSNENRVLREIVPPGSVKHPLPFSASTSSSSSSSSDGYEVVVKLPANWPNWAIPKDPKNDSNKS